MRVLLNLDWELQTWLQSHRTDAFDRVMTFTTHLGDRWFLTVVVVLGLVVLLVRGRRRDAVALLVAALASLAIVEGVKWVIRRDRPFVSNPLVPALESYSFPSGHALSSAAVYGLLGLIAARSLSSFGGRLAVVAGALVLVFLVGFSRLYLGVHYGTDVIAGWAGGWALACLSAWWANRTTGSVSPGP